MHLNFWRCIHSHPERIPHCRRILASHSYSKHSLVFQVQQALSLFHLSFSPDLDLLFYDIALPILEIGVRELRQLLQVLAIQYCYERAADQKRKDIVKPQGFVDHYLSTAFRRNASNTQGEPDLIPYFESQLVGCTLANDRLCAANLVESNLCRICHQQPESMPHWIFECGNAFPLLQPPRHEFGENFAMLGICEHPVGICKHRLQFTSILQDVPAAYDPLARRESLWTDGSVFFPETFWLTTAGCSVIDERGQCILAERVCSPSLSSYSAELFAIYRACLHASSDIHIFSDCKSIVDQLNLLLQVRKVDQSWNHNSWWKAILQIVEQRPSQDGIAVQISWIPAHVGDDLPDYLITPEFAASRGTTVRNILFNRKADQAAKRVASEFLPMYPHIFSQQLQAVVQRQHFLSRLDELSTPEVSDPVNVDVTPSPPADASIQQRFSRWDWAQSICDFPWRSSGGVDTSCSWFKQHTSSDVDTFFSFAQTLAWKVGDAFCTSYMELAVLFHKRNFTLEACSGDGITYRDLSFWLRKMFVFIGKIPGQSVFPGYTCLQTRKSEGRSFPQGAIVGAVPFMCTEELHRLAVMMDAGYSKILTSWEIPLHSPSS